MSTKKHSWRNRFNPSFHRQTSSIDDSAEEAGSSSPPLVKLAEAAPSGRVLSSFDLPHGTNQNYVQSLQPSATRQRLSQGAKRTIPIDHSVLHSETDTHSKTVSSDILNLPSERDKNNQLTKSHPSDSIEHPAESFVAHRTTKTKNVRPLLRRAISEANCRVRATKEQAAGRNELRKHKHSRARSNRDTPAVHTGHAQLTFDSSILEMPIDLLKEVNADLSECPYAEQNMVELLHNSLHTEVLGSVLMPARSHQDIGRPKYREGNRIRRMHSTAVDSRLDPNPSFEVHNYITPSRNTTESVKGVTFSEFQHRRLLPRYTSFEELSSKTNVKRISELKANNETSAGQSSTHTALNYPVSTNESSTDKATNTVGHLTQPHTNCMAVAVADGNFVELYSDYGKQSTSSYLKEQFLAFFQPSDNKLAMKLFGSKNALLKEKRRQVQQGKWVIHPCSSFRFYWDLLMLVLLIANLIILPVAIAFFNDDLSVHWIVFNSISDVIFVADIAVKFRTGIVANDYADEIILNPKEIARHYLKSWFILDFISSIPMDYIYLIFNKKDHYNQFLSAGRTLRILRLAKLLSMLRLLRLTRLVRYVSQWEEFLNIASKFMGIFNLVLLMLLLGHWNACLQYLIPMLMEFPPDSWVKRCKLENADWFQQYTWALFKAMSHMLSIGYGRFPPISISDAWITIVSMMSGATCYALFVGHAAALIQSFDTSKRLYREKFKQVEEYMAYRKLPRALRQRIANYYEHRYQGKMFDEAQILNEFSECLREQVINYNCRALVAAVPFFTYADQDFVSEVVTKLKFEVFQPGDLIIKEGTIGNKMYFIQEGIVDIITKDGEVATSLSDGSYFGEICLLTNARRVASVKAVVYSNLYSLDRESFLSVLENYPLMRRTMESVAAERLSKIGQNPSIVSTREDLKEDLSLVKEIVSSAVTPEGSVTETESDNEGAQVHLNLKHFLKIRKPKLPSTRIRSIALCVPVDSSHSCSDLSRGGSPISSATKMSRLFRFVLNKRKSLLDTPVSERVDAKNQQTKKHSIEEHLITQQSSSEQKEVAEILEELIPP